MKAEEVRKVIKGFNTADVRHSYAHHKLNDRDLKNLIEQVVL